MIQFFRSRFPFSLTPNSRVNTRTLILRHRIKKKNYYYKFQACFSLNFVETKIKLELVKNYLFIYYLEIIPLKREATEMGVLKVNLPCTYFISPLVL